jgi:hypothetical protein
MDRFYASSGGAPGGMPGGGAAPGGFPGAGAGGNDGPSGKSSLPCTHFGHSADVQVEEVD